MSEKENARVLHVTVRFHFEPQEEDAEDKLAHAMDWVRAGMAAQGIVGVIWTEPHLTVLSTTRQKLLDRLEAKRKREGDRR